MAQIRFKITDKLNSREMVSLCSKPGTDWSTHTERDIIIRGVYSMIGQAESRQINKQ